MITLFSTGCPKCRTLKKKLDSKKIQYVEVNDVNEMRKLGFKAAPVLEVDGKIMDFNDALRWTFNQEGGNIYEKQ